MRRVGLVINEETVWVFLKRGRLVWCGGPVVRCGVVWCGGVCGPHVPLPWPWLRYDMAGVRRQTSGCGRGVG